LRSGEVHLFIIKHPDEAARELQTLLTTEPALESG
jgi:hypothetical protein